MEAIVMNTNFESVGLIDTFNSFIWTDRYSSYGDFEIYTLPSAELLEMCQDDYYVWNIKTDHVMIIEERKIVADPDISICYRKIIRIYINSKNHMETNDSSRKSSGWY